MTAVRMVGGALGLGALAAIGLWQPVAESKAPSPRGNLVVRPLGLVSADAPEANHAEPWLAVDPKDAGRVVAVGILEPGDGSVVYASSDTGKTWRRGSHSGPDSRTFPGIDPVVTFDDHGTVYLATITPFRVWRSSDGGTSWKGPALVPGRSFDREFLGIQSMPDGPDTIYAIAKAPITIFGHLANDVLALSRSTDGAKTFEAPRLLLPDPVTSIIHTPGSFLVTQSGTMLIPFLAHDAPVKDLALIANHIWIMRSDDGGRRFTDPIAAVASVMHGNRGDELKMLKSLSAVRLVLDSARRSPNRGRLYLGFLSVVETRLQVMVAVSNDTGRTWLPAVKVNDDASLANHSNPAIAVNDHGVLAVVWNDRRADPKDFCFRATASASLDGGATFLPSTSIVTTDTCPLGPEPKRPLNLTGFAGRYVQGGETQGLAALPGGKFLAVVVGGGASAMQLHAAMIEVRNLQDQH